MTRTFYRLDERLCLDFVNTVGYHTGDHPNEWLTDYTRLANWSYEAGALNEERQRDQLLQLAGQAPEEADRVLGQAVELREALFRVLCSVVRKERAPAEDMERINLYLSRSGKQFKLIADDANRFSMPFRPERVEMDSMLGPVVRSAADLLLSPDLARLKLCGADACGWLFLDTSRNHSRRWCSMDDCGNKEKAKRFYRKKTK
ncbi:CGNR zinc finger domain-containing protein [Paenibacillus pasadenensis]|nr:ABATE domain-containing protein [Paenibacillus pasadenensis]